MLSSTSFAVNTNFVQARQHTNASHPQQLIYRSCLVREHAGHSPQLQRRCNCWRQAGGWSCMLRLACRQLLDVRHLQKRDVDRVAYDRMPAAGVQADRTPHVKTQHPERACGPPSSSEISAPTCPWYQGNCCRCSRNWRGPIWVVSVQAGYCFISCGGRAAPCCLAATAAAAVSPCPAAPPPRRPAVPARCRAALPPARRRAVASASASAASRSAAAAAALAGADSCSPAACSWAAVTAAGSKPGCHRTCCSLRGAPEPLRRPCLKGATKPVVCSCSSSSTRTSARRKHQRCRTS